MRHRNQGGFTLVELAIVLVIVGLILGMAFKGRDLIDGAKVKSMAAQYNKVLAGINTYYERYGAYPGDGCAGEVGTATTCGGLKNGMLTSTEERQWFWAVLNDNTGILPTSYRKSAFGANWDIVYVDGSTGHYAGNSNYLVLANSVTPGGSTGQGGSGDERFVCALDQLSDDGNPAGGAVRSSSTGYGATSDCWALTGTATLGLRLLP